MSAPSLAQYIMKRPFLSKLFRPAANWFGRASGYRQLGLRSDDLIPEEDEVVLLALKRLSQKESYDRVYRLRRALQCSVTHSILPVEHHTKPEDDVPYLSPLIAQIEAENKERADLESLTLGKK